jgi:dTDP-4-amino-4,6-dideoxygalactose transaminase
VWFEEQVQLPIYPQMTDADVDYVIEAVARALEAPSVRSVNTAAT